MLWRSRGLKQFLPELGATSSLIPERHRNSEQLLAAEKRLAKQSVRVISPAHVDEEGTKLPETSTPFEIDFKVVEGSIEPIFVLEYFYLLPPLVATEILRHIAILKFEYNLG